MSPTRARARKSAARSKGKSDAPETPKRPFTAHHLVPPHEILTESEAARVIAELGTSIERLPKILVTDPGLKTDPKYSAMREAREVLAGRLVRIRRPSATAGEAVAYRVLADHVGE